MGLKRFTRISVWGNKVFWAEDTGRDEALFVTPPNDLDEASIKSLKLNLFDEDAEDDDDEALLSKGMITREQLNRFQSYKQDRIGEEVDKVTDIVKNWSSSRKERLIQEFQAPYFNR